MDRKERKRTITVAMRVAGRHQHHFASLALGN